MHRDVKARTPFPETCMESAIWQDVSAGVVEEMQSLLAPYGIGPARLDRALNEALQELSEQSRIATESTEALRSSLVRFILWKIFVGTDTLWIDSRTEQGNEVPLQLLVAGYVLWKSAVNLAAKHNLDTAVAAETLARATHATADQLARKEHDANSREIRNLRSYLYATYMYSIFEVAGTQPLSQIECVDMEDWISRREFSDQGAFLEAIESGIFCRELLRSMPPKGRSAAIARYILGYSWPETAESLGTSVNAAQKALSAGIRDAIGACISSIRRMGHRKGASLQSSVGRTRKRHSKVTKAQP